MDAASSLGNGKTAARWSLRLFGDFQLSERASGEKVALPRKRERVLLAYLALGPNCRQPRRKLVTLLWGEAADETTLDNLRTCVFNVRKALGDTEHNVIASEDRDIVLDASAFEVDVLSFRRLAIQSGVAELEEAAKLYTGDFLEGLSIESDEFESWRREEATRCKGQVLDCLTRLMTQLAESGEMERAIEAGSRILRLEPLHEAAVRGLMRLYAGSGRRGTAVEVYRTLTEALRKELGAQPEAETRAVFAVMSRGDERTQAAAGADAKAPSTIVPPSDAPRKPLPSPAQQSIAAQSAPRRVAPQKAKTRTLGWIAAGGLAAALAIFFAYPLATESGTTTPQQTAVEAKADTIAIAVLPFANLSGDPSQEFFSDGMTQEITAALAKVKGLTVLARTSAFEFKGQNRDIRAIGEALNARYLIEGSVRKEGDRVRITAQLVQADNGANVWSENYDRQLASVFATQEDIAQAIAGALMAPLGLQQGESLVRSRPRDQGVYEDYLRAKARLRSRQFIAAGPILEQIEKVVARDPDFAPAWALLGYTHSLAPNYSPPYREGAIKELRAIVEASLPKAEAAANRAIQLDPKNADGYVALAHVQHMRGKWREAEDLFSRALALDPDNPDALMLYSVMLANLGHLKRALSVSERLRLLEPFVPIFAHFNARLAWLTGQTETAIALLKPLPGRRPLLARIYASQGRYGEAADELLQSNPQLRQGQKEEAARLLRTAPKHVPSPKALPALGDSEFVYLHVGAPDRVLDIHEDTVNVGYLGPRMNLLWDASYGSIRKTDRFKTLMRNAGMVDYWREHGWPDLCRPVAPERASAKAGPVGADDFVCD